MSADRKGLNISLWDSAKGKNSNSLTDRNRIALKYLMTPYLLYSTECLTFTVKLLIFCILMNISSSKSVKRYCIHKESEYQD